MFESQNGQVMLRWSGGILIAAPQFLQTTVTVPAVPRAAVFEYGPLPARAANIAKPIPVVDWRTTIRASMPLRSRRLRKFSRWISSTLGIAPNSRDQENE